MSLDDKYPILVATDLNTSRVQLLVLLPCLLVNYVEVSIAPSYCKVLTVPSIVSTEQIVLIFLVAGNIVHDLVRT